MSTTALQTAYESSPIRKRRKPEEIDLLCDSLIKLLTVERPMTVRQIFYRAVSSRLVEKSEGEYKATICRLLGKLRRDGRVPYDWIADFTRWMRKPNSYAGLRSALEHTQRIYRRDLWQNQDAYVEVWLEKDALSGVVYDVTEVYDVPLMVTRGYASMSFLHSAAEAILAKGKPTYLYYFGDYDPSGVNIPVTVERTLRELAPGAEIYFKRAAVTPEQIRDFELPTRPTKKTDSRSKNFEGESVEVDAIPPDSLRALVRECIEQHIDRGALVRLQEVEEAEKQTLRNILLTVDGEFF